MSVLALLRPGRGRHRRRARALEPGTAIRTCAWTNCDADATVAYGGWQTYCPRHADQMDQTDTDLGFAAKARTPARGEGRG